MITLNKICLCLWHFRLQHFELLAPLDSRMYCMYCTTYVFIWTGESMHSMTIEQKTDLRIEGCIIWRAGHAKKFWLRDNDNVTT